MFKAIFVNPHMEGLIKDFYLTLYCQKNLQLAQYIVFQIMTFQEWEVATPETEITLADKGKPDLFTLPKDIT